MKAAPDDFTRAIAAQQGVVDRLDRRLKAAQAELALLHEGRRFAAGLVPAPAREPPAVVDIGTPAVQVEVLVRFRRDGTWQPVALQEGAWPKTLTDSRLVADEGEAGQRWRARLPTGERCRLEVDLGPLGRQEWWLLATEEEVQNHV